MGIVIPFRPRPSAPQVAPPALPGARPDDRPDAWPNAWNDAEIAVRQAHLAGGDVYDVLEAASDLLAVCRNRYGVTVMQDGLPRQPGALAGCLVALLRGLILLEPEFAGCRPIPRFGVRFGGTELEWFENGRSGDSGLSLPVGIGAEELARFARPRIRAIRRR